MGRQINFYMSESVQAEFMEFLKQNQFIYYDYYTNKVENPADKKLYAVYLYRENYGVFLRKKNDNRYIDDMDGPVIEFSKSIINAETKKIT